MAGLGCASSAAAQSALQQLPVPIPIAQGGTGGATTAAARTNLGVAATGLDTTYAYRANNLSDIANPGVALANLGGVSSSNPSFSGTLTATALDIAGVSGSTQCLHVNTAGLVSGTGSDCSSTVLPGAGIPLSSGSAWGTSYSVSGSGSVALTTSPILVTPTLGAASATSINGNVITPGTSTYTGSAGATYTFPSTSATIARTDAVSQTFGGQITLGAQLGLANSGNAFFNTTAINGYKLNSKWLLYAGTPTVAAANFQSTGSPAVGGNGSNLVIVTLTGAASASGTITFASGLAPTGWSCMGNDLSTAGVSFRETSTTTTTAVIGVSGSPGVSDTYQFHCFPY